MATPVLMSLTSALLGPGTSEIVGACAKVLAERVKTAHDNYQQTTAQAIDMVENERHQAISKINELRNRAALSVADPDLQQKVWCLLMEQTAEVYEATTARGISLVNDNTGQIKALLDSYQQAMNYRHRARAIAVVVSVLSLAGIGYFLYFAYANGMKGEAALPVLGVPSCVLLWSVIGSFAAILYRFSNAGDRELEDPLRWLFSRPLTGIIMGAITFLVLRAGLLTMSPAPAEANAVEKLGTNEIMWLVAFLAGFSDRFADGLLKSLVGRFGGEKNSDLIAMQMTSKQTSARILDQLTSLVSRGKNGEDATPAAPDSAGKGKSQALALVEKPEAALAAVGN